MSALLCPVQLAVNIAVRSNKFIADGIIPKIPVAGFLIRFSTCFGFVQKSGHLRKLINLQVQSVISIYSNNINLTIFNFVFGILEIILWMYRKKSLLLLRGKCAVFGVWTWCIVLRIQFFKRNSSCRWEHSDAQLLHIGYVNGRSEPDALYYAFHWLQTTVFCDINVRIELTE